MVWDVAHLGALNVGGGPHSAECVPFADCRLALSSAKSWVSISYWVEAWYWYGGRRSWRSFFSRSAPSRVAVWEHEFRGVQGVSASPSSWGCTTGGVQIPGGRVLGERREFSCVVVSRGESGREPKTEPEKIRVLG